MDWTRKRGCHDRRPPPRAAGAKGDADFFHLRLNKQTLVQPSRTVNTIIVVCPVVLGPAGLRRFETEGTTDCRRS